MRIKAKRIYEPKKQEEHIDLQKIIANAFSSTILQAEKTSKWLSIEIEKENTIVDKVMTRITNELNKMKLDKAAVTQDVYDALLQWLNKVAQDLMFILENHEHDYLTQDDKDECMVYTDDTVNKFVSEFNITLTSALEKVGVNMEEKCWKEYMESKYNELYTEIEENEAEIEEKIATKADREHNHKIKDVLDLEKTLSEKADKGHTHDQYATREELEFIAMQRRSWGWWAHVIQQDGNVKNQRWNLNFVGATVTDDPQNNATIVTITSWWVTDWDKWDITVSWDWAIRTIDDGVVTEAKLNASVNTSLDLADTALQAADITWLVPYTWATQDVNLWTNALIANTWRAATSAGVLIESANGTDIGLLWAWNTANVTWYGSHNYSTATQDTIAIFTGTWKTLWSAALATYPSLAELAYVKWVTSAIQTQLNAKLWTAWGTMSGDIVLWENTSLQLDGVLSADGKWSWTTITATAWYTQAFGDLVYLDPTDSRWEACDANAASGADWDCRGLIGMVVVAGTDGNACTILLNWTIRADANFPTLTVGWPVFASETAWDVVTTAPSTSGAVVRVLGSALTADSMYFNPSGDFIVNV